MRRASRWIFRLFVCPVAGHRQTFEYVRFSGCSGCGAPLPRSSKVPAGTERGCGS